MSKKLESLSLRYEPDLKEKLKRAAEAANCTVSEFARDAIYLRVEKVLQPDKS